MATGLETRLVNNGNHKNNGGSNGDSNGKTSGFFSSLRNYGSQLFGYLSRRNGNNNKGSNGKNGSFLERKNIEVYLSSRYNISDEKLKQLINVIEYERSASKGKKSMEDIILEEEKFSKQYREFKEYINANPKSFVARSIGKIVIDKLNSEYKKHNGKRSVARIYNELIKSEKFRVGFKAELVNGRPIRYDSYVNNETEDIRNLQVYKLRKFLNFRKNGAESKDYSEGKLSQLEKESIKQGIMNDLYFFIRKESSELRDKFGFNIYYKGFDDFIGKKYHSVINGFENNSRTSLAHSA